VIEEAPVETELPSYYSTTSEIQACEENLSRSLIYNGLSSLTNHSCQKAARLLLRPSFSRHHIPQESRTTSLGQALGSHLLRGAPPSSPSVPISEAKHPNGRFLGGSMEEPHPRFWVLGQETGNGMTGCPRHVKRSRTFFSSFLFLCCQRFGHDQTASTNARRVPYFFHLHSMTNERKK
jgi:hypothetical protein